MNTSVSSSPPVLSIELGAPGSIERVERLVAGAPVEITWPGEDVPLRAFLKKAIGWAYDPTITVGELYNLVYGDQNPLLVVEGNRVVVTREAHDHPVMALLGELIDRKRAAFGHLDVEAARARFTMPVAEAALRLGRHQSAIRQLIAAGRLPARREGNSWLLDPAAVEAYRGVRRGPAPRTSPDATEAEGSDALNDLTEKTVPRRNCISLPPAPKLELEETTPETTPAPATPSKSVSVKIGHAGGAHVRIKGARIVEPRREGETLEGELAPGWGRLFVLSYVDAEEKGTSGARLFILEPEEGADREWTFRGFYVRGAFREVERENNPRRARERFER